MVTLESVQKNTEVEALILGAQKQLDGLGYTEHSHRHISIVSKRAGDILEKLGYPERTVELARIAGYLHDIGNCVNRTDHAHSGAIMAFNILKDMGMPVEERTEIMMAIGNHDESTGTAVSEISAALILADKSDVHRNRVTNTNLSTFDIHDRVNYAVTNAQLDLNSEERKIILNLTCNLKTPIKQSQFQSLNYEPMCFDSIYISPDGSIHKRIVASQDLANDRGAC